MGQRPAILVLAVLALWGGLDRPALAFSPRARAEIVRRAITLMPDGLQRQLRRHARSLFAGSLEETAGRPPAGVDALDPGQTDLRLEAKVHSTIALIDRRQPMAEIAKAFGEISLLSSDLSFALNIGRSDPREAEFHRQFQQYVELKLSRMSVVFHGFANRHLARGDLAAFAREIGHLARRDYDGVLRSYYPEGRDRLPQDFDERSVAFAAASVEVSLAVTSTARAWLYTWYKAHGDLTGAALLPEAAHENPFVATPPQRRAMADHSARRTP